MLNQISFYIQKAGRIMLFGALFFNTGFLKVPDPSWTCPKCGYENLEGINKCGLCGTPNSLMERSI